MDCPNWPPPLPTLPLYPPCREVVQPPPPEIKIIESQTQKWWNDQLVPAFNRVSGVHRNKKGNTFELTRLQRRELLPVRAPTREDKLIWSVPLPEGSYPHDGLPIWERLYLDRKLPMLKCPPNALIFARQQIGKKLWKDTEGQEFVLYDPHSYEVAFSYENVHDPHLTNYYQGKEIRGFLLSVGDATEDGWGLCSLKRFNQYRKYLKRVHLSLVHTEMERQEALKDEIHKLKEYKQTTKAYMEFMERKVMVDEMRASIVEALRQEKENKIKRILASIQEKEDRVRQLQIDRENEKEMRRQRGLQLLAQQELKNKIATEIKRRKKIATLRRWHDTEEKKQKMMKKLADERARQKAEKVRLRWQNKIDNLRKMFERDDNFLSLQKEVREKNIEIRNTLNERRKQKEKDCFQEIRKEGLRKKAMIKRQKEERRMERAITNAWLRINKTPYDLGTEIYRIKKSINSTMAELLTTQMEGPDRLSIILMSRNRIQREQKIPLPVSYAIDALLETVIQAWATVRILLILESVICQVKENGHSVLSDIKAQRKDLGIPSTGSFKAGDPYGVVYRPDPKKEKNSKQKDKNSDAQKSSAEGTTVPDSGPFESQAREEDSEVEIGEFQSSQPPSSKTNENKLPMAVVPNYVHYGPSITHEYPVEYELEGELKSIADRPKTPMPTQELLCEVGFREEKLNDILPTLDDNVKELKEKQKFTKVFKMAAVKLFEKSISISKVALEPVTRTRAIYKLKSLGDTGKLTLTRVFCDLLMNKHEKAVYESEEFEWLAKVVAFEALKEVLNPPEFRREGDDRVARTKIMFYKPKQKRQKET